MRLSRFAAAIFLTMAWAAVVHAQPAKAASTPTKDIQYARDSVELAAIQTEVYRWAWRAVAAAAKKQKGHWAIIMDIDQTVLDNAGFQEELGDRPFSLAVWKGWTAKANAKAVPGVKEFIDKVRTLPHGEIAFITDRGDDEAAATLKNLRDQGLYKNGDVLLTKHDKSDNKGVRRDCVEKAVDARCKASGPRTLIALFGDSARDFEEYYGQDMETTGRQDILREAGIRYFVLPNPMYGQWQDGYK